MGMNIEISTNCEVNINPDKVIRLDKGKFIFLTDTHREGMKESGKFLMPERRTRGSKPVVIADGIGYSTGIVEVELSQSAGKKLRAELNKVAEER